MTVKSPQRIGINRTRLSALPPEYRIPDQRPTLEEHARTAGIWPPPTTRIPCSLMVSTRAPSPHFHCIYAYCRHADDLAMKSGNREQSLALLDLWGGTRRLLPGQARHPVFVALTETIRACDIPQQRLPIC